MKRFFFFAASFVLVLAVFSPVRIPSVSAANAITHRFLPITPEGMFENDPVAEPNPSTTQKVIAVWKVLLLVYPNIDVNYTDGDGTNRHLTYTLPQSEVQDGIRSFRHFVSIAYDFSNQEAFIQFDIVLVNRPINTLSSMGTNVWWVSPSDTQQELDLYAPEGTYDSVLVLWPQTNFSTGQQIPSGGWGLAIPATGWSNNATYAAVANAPTWMWDLPTVGEVWLHEWLHGVCDYYEARGFAMPSGNADGGGSHGYIHSPDTGWAVYYRDLMTGHVLENGMYKGITTDAWKSGTILATKKQILVDYFNSDTTSAYQKQGTVSWKSNPPEGEYIELGIPTTSDNKIYIASNSLGNPTISGRVFIPASGIGIWDSVAIAMRDDQVEFWATLAYGTDLAERNHISIMQDEIWGDLYPYTFSSGWYNAKVFLDYQGDMLWMKVWPDGENEPSWQVSHSMPPNWVATQIGFRHYGQGTRVDDLLVIQDAFSTFSDVSIEFWAFTWIERIYAAGITGGCNLIPLQYCPDSPVTRAQMAVFLERGMHGSTFSPPDVAPTFGDTAGHWAEDWIEALSADGITAGCGGGNYCPEQPTTRAQMAVFLLRAKHGASYTPPTTVPITFGDTGAHWARYWIEQLATEGITAGCGGGNYCPENPVTRAEMAVFLVRTFNLP